MKNIVRISLIILAAAILYGCMSMFKISDLRPEGYAYPNNPQKAKTLLEKMAIAHNIQIWDSIDTYNVIFEDDFYGFLGKQTHPFKDQSMSFSLDYIPKTFDGQMEIISGKEKGYIWGMQDWKTYSKNKNEVILKEDKDMKFWIPTYQYFIEFPSRIQEASAIDYVGTKKINGIDCEGLIASWNTVNPQKELDQYIIWVDSKSHMIVKVEYTIREAFKFLTGAAYFQDYKNYDGLILPSNLPVESNLKKEGFLHKMSIKNFTRNKLSTTALMPLSKND